MKIVFLNALRAGIREPLKKLIQTRKDTTDVFCFQEADGAMQDLIREILPDFTYTDAAKPEAGHDNTYHVATLVRPELSIESSASNADSKETGLALYTAVRVNGTVVHIANVHGIPRPGKLDFPARILQSQEILDAHVGVEGPAVIGGDFNVLPETQSVRMFEDAGYNNLIRDFSITTTHNHITWDKHPGDEHAHSDYVFVKNAKVSSFVVPTPDIVISDHQPMIVTLELK